MTLLNRSASVLARVVAFARERGAWSVLSSCVRWVWQWLLGLPGAGRRSASSFGWDGRQVAYFHHRYNNTWMNERGVEIALALEVLEQYADRDVLEIGYVTAHYVPTKHLVVDKYEQAPGVVNADVADLVLDERFDLILAVSTLEHVGLDEEVLDSAKAGRAIAGLKRLLKPGGKLWVTLPIGYNLDLDRQFETGELGFDLRGALLREDNRNVWREVPVEQIWWTPYDRLTYTAHGLVVAEYVAPA
ncbi:methyltransferase domain-containing protein [Nocardioides sp. URHA0020]|uniref:methyltransferase domain-containing protein n=1 Tax=Nocardioides sp. URHA0020 TaxID=1380392 RepID=UPI0004906D2D|nr:class I SAM-dependent methyltransferase [Nocardioides sp. URHA0020]